MLEKHGHDQENACETGIERRNDRGTDRVTADGQRLQIQKGTSAPGAKPSFPHLIESITSVAIAPLQDVLRIGSEGRMNLPGTDEENWQWRYKPEALTAELARDLMELSAKEGRLPASI